MEVVFLIAAFNALFFSLLLYQKRPAAKQDTILIFWMMYLGFYTGVYGLTSSFLFTDYPLWSAAFISLLMLHGPFLYWYARSLVMPQYRPSRSDLLHLMPFLLFNLYILINALSLASTEGIRLDHSGEHGGEAPLFVFFLVLTALSGPIYFAFTISLFKRLDIRIFNQFSSLKDINLRWLRTLVLAFGVVWTLLVAAAAMHHMFRLFSWSFCTDGLALSLSIFIILIGYFGLRQREIFPGTTNLQYAVVDSEDKKYSSSNLKAEDAIKLKNLVEMHMTTSKPYLNPELSLSQLAGEINVSPHHLSQVINEHFERNFFDFVNWYRVQEVKERLIDPEYNHLSVLGIAFEAGFNSKSAFNRVFKNVEGETPTQFKKRQSVSL